MCGELRLASGCVGTYLNERTFRSKRCLRPPANSAASSDLRPRAAKLLNQVLTASVPSLSPPESGEPGSGAVDAALGFEQNNDPFPVSFLAELLTYAMDLLLKLSAFPTLLAQAADAAAPVNTNAEHWLVKWASPFFLVGAGILAGLILLACFRC